MYRCSRCGATMPYPLDHCPKCNVLLCGVKCEACGYVGGKQEFIDRGHRCPKCGSSVKIPAAASSGCFVATAVYGDYECSQVMILRRFRDEILEKSRWGRNFITFYYQNGPSWAQMVKRRPWFSFIIRKCLDLFVKLLDT